MSSSIALKKSNLTLAYINSTNNLSQLEVNIKDICNNIIILEGLVDNLFNKLQISDISISSYQTALIDISNNL